MASESASKSISDTNRRILKSEVGARAIIDLVDWYDNQWNQSRDFKEELIELLNKSKFGEFEYTPYDIYLKAIYSYFKDDLDVSEMPNVRSAVELSEFQEDAVKKARRILAKYDGVLIGELRWYGEDLDWQKTSRRLCLSSAHESAGSLPCFPARHVGERTAFSNHSRSSYYTGVAWPGRRPSGY